nr:HNH endonuclease signature motif containing protein [Weissella minor]
MCSTRTSDTSKVVDHIVPIEYDVERKADVENLAIICGRCHSKKTAWEQQYYGTGTQQTKQSVPEIKSVAAIVKLIEK